MSLNVPKFTLKNKTDQLNEENWRHLYNNNDPVDITSNQKQLPWMTLYKTHNDLLQIKLVTTIGYQETGPSTEKYKAMFMSGFPLLLQGSTDQYNSPNNISSNHWEYNWSFYKNNITDFSGNIWDGNTAFSDITNAKVWSNFGLQNRKNLLILDLSNNDFVLKGRNIDDNTDNSGNKFTMGNQSDTGDSNMYNDDINNKKRPPYLVIRLDTAIEETSFFGSDGINNTWGLITDNDNYWKDSSHDTTKAKLKVYNYVYSGYVISPYDFMANFTTDYLRGIIHRNGRLSMGYINMDQNETTSPNVIQVNSKFFSATHQLKDGWDNTRKNKHNLIKTPYYYNFFLQGKAIKTEDINSNDNDRFNLIDVEAVDLDPELDGQNYYHIEKLFWSSLTSARHTQYSDDKIDSVKDRLFIGNYLNVNEVDPSYNTTDNERVFLNSNADYMPIKTNTGFKASGYIEREFNKSTYSGKREINIPRKTLTPYYYPDTEEQHEKYAFNWKNDDISWDSWQSSQEYVNTDTSGIDVSNCEVIELRNLIEFNQDTSMSIDISLNNTSDAHSSTGKKNITFVTTEMDLADLINNFNTPGYIIQYNHETWKNNVQLLNNSVYTKKQDGAHKLGEEKRKVQYINSEIFEISWFNEPANTKKHMYVIDIATGRYEINNISISRNHKENSNIPVDTFVPSNWEEHINEVFSFTANVYQIKVNKSTITNGDIDREGDHFLNFSLDGQKGQASIYSEPYAFSDLTIENIYTNSRPIFGYFNFFGLTSSEFLGGVDWHRGLNPQSNISGKVPGAINLCLTKILNNIKTSTLQRKALEGSPYYLLEDDSRFKSDFKDISKMYFNSNIFYNSTNFPLTNVYGAITTTGTYDQTDILFKNKINGPQYPKWRNITTATNGIEISTLSHNIKSPDKTNKFFFIDHTGIEIFHPVLLGKFDRNNRIFIDPNANIYPPCVELNAGTDLSFNDIISGEQIPPINLTLECLNFYKVAFVASQKNLFISDYWEWNNRLVQSPFPEESYDGNIPIGYQLDSRDIEKRYNVYNWKTPYDTYYAVPPTLYGNGMVHNPQRAFENQSLINFSIEVSTISINMSHMLINTWAGNLNTVTNNLNSQSIVGLSSSKINNGTYDIIYGSPKIIIQGGFTLSPSIEDKAVYLKFDISGNKLNFATDNTDGVSDDDLFSKAPSGIPESENASPIVFPIDLFSKNNNGTLGGWFSYNPTSLGDISINRNGIFVPIADNAGTPPARFYRTVDFSGNVLEKEPTNIIIDPNKYPLKGGFTKEQEAFPLELLFTSPSYDPDISQNFPLKLDSVVTHYPNSDGDTTIVEFDNYKGYKRFSSMYALKISGDHGLFNHPSFLDRDVFPETVIVNCVELPPPVQVNNINDMLASDNGSVKIVWKGYNFENGPDNTASSQGGNVGNIKWKIVRFQTQLEIRKTILDDIIEPRNNDGHIDYNLSTYTFIDNNVRIYDKYKYTVSGTFIYNFRRDNRDTTIYRLEMPFGSFTTPEIIICKNNKFEYGRYNTTSTNLKLFRPLLIKRDGGQVDEDGNQTAGGVCFGNIFRGSTRISSSQNIYANTSNTLTKKQTYVLLSKQQFQPFR